MARLNRKELRKEYIRFLKSDRLEFGLMGFLVLGGVIYGILSFVNGLWKLLAVIPIVLIFLLIKRLKEINKQIKDNK